MIFDLSQPSFNNEPQWPRFCPTSLTFPHHTATEPADAELVELMMHADAHIDARFHFFPEAEPVDALRSSHIRSACASLSRPNEAHGSGLAAVSLKPHSSKFSKGFIVLVKTGWGDPCGLAWEFPSARPYLTSQGAKYWGVPGIHGAGIEGLSIAGFDDSAKDTAVPDAVLGAEKLIVENMRLPVLIEKAGSALTRTAAWGEEEMA